MKTLYIYICTAAGMYGIFLYPALDGLDPELKISIQFQSRIGLEIPENSRILDQCASMSCTCGTLEVMNLLYTHDYIIKPVNY